jgi:MSP (Major sperm protein) domain
MSSGIADELVRSAEEALAQNGATSKELVFESEVFEFSRGEDGDLRTQMFMKNQGEAVMAFKVRVTNSSAYLVSPCIYVVLPRSSFSVKVQYTGKDVGSLHCLSHNSTDFCFR